MRERLVELLGCDIKTVDGAGHWDLIAELTRSTIAWRDLCLLLGQKTSFHYFQVPPVMLEPDTPSDYKREFIRGYADVAGNARPANRDQTGRHRVRLDTLSSKGNWQVPVHLCLILQEFLGVPVPVITWGHPNLGREWREHQLNIYAEEFLKVGFFFGFKMTALQELAAHNAKMPGHAMSGCPGRRRLGQRKVGSREERNADKLDDRLLGQHFDAYWQICKALGCPREPRAGDTSQLELPLEA